MRSNAESLRRAPATVARKTAPLNATISVAATRLRRCLRRCADEHIRAAASSPRVTVADTSQGEPSRRVDWGRWWRPGRSGGAGTTLDGPAPGPGARRTGSPRDLVPTCTHQSRPKRFASAARFLDHVGSSRLPVHYTGTPAPGARPGQFERGPEAGRSEFLGSVTGRLRGQPVALGTPLPGTRADGHAAAGLPPGPHRHQPLVVKRPVLPSRRRRAKKFATWSSPMTATPTTNTNPMTTATVVSNWRWCTATPSPGKRTVRRRR